MAAVLIGPDWEASALGSVRPVLLWDTAYLTLLVTLVGTSVAPWMPFYLQAALVEKGITVKDYAESRIEVIVSFLLFSAGLLNASLFAGSIQPLSTAYSVCEGLGFESGVNKRFRMIKLVNNRDLMHKWTNPRVYNWVAWVAVVILVALTSVLVGITLRDMYFG